LGWHKKFGPAQNILEPVKGQGICVGATNYLHIVPDKKNDDLHSVKLVFVPAVFEEALKVVFYQKVRFVFQISQSPKKIIPKNYPELEI
jgi:hypothetical protein